MISIPIKFALPLVILLAQFLLKNLIGKQVNGLDLIKGFLELPVSILFVSLSLVSSAIATEVCKGDVGLFFVISILVLVAIAILCWRWSISYFEKKRFGLVCLIGFINFSLSIPTLIFILFFLISLAKAKIS